MDKTMDIQTMRNRINSCYMDQPFVFVSYSKADAKRVYPFVLKLQEMRCNLWIDKELNKLVGKNWQMGAVQAMLSENCKAILFMISEDSLKSAPVLAELTLSRRFIKVLRKHGADGIRIIPVNADAKWSQSKVGLATWITNDVSSDAAPVTEDDLACMDIGGLLDKYILPDSINRIEEKGEIAHIIFEDILKPLGGGKMTVAGIEDIETIRNNIDGSCFCLTDEQMLGSASVITAVSSEVSENPQSTSVRRHVYPNGDIYEGEMKDGLREGRGRLVYKNGAVYEGEFRNDMCHGRGVYRSPKGLKYEGDFVNGEREGTGKYTYLNGDVYEGGIKSGKRHGQGRFYFKTGEVKECEWCDNVPVQKI